MKNFLFCFISLSFLFNSCIQNKTNSPNFILILSDDQGWSGTSVQMSNNINSSKSNYFETPNLKRLSSNGMRFSRGYSAAPVCTPSRYSIQFGKTPARLSLIRVGMNSDHIPHEKIKSILEASFKGSEVILSDSDCNLTLTIVSDKFISTHIEILT